MLSLRFIIIIFCDGFALFVFGYRNFLVERKTDSKLYRSKKGSYILIALFLLFVFVIALGFGGKQGFNKKKLNGATALRVEKGQLWYKKGGVVASVDLDDLNDISFRLNSKIKMDD